MKKLSFLLIILLCKVCCFAQNTVEEMNNIKLSGQYFTGEATGNTDDEAKQFALSNLMEVLANYCEENECAMVKESDVTPKMKDMKMQRGDKKLVLLYVPRTIVTPGSNQTTSASSASITSPPTQVQNTNVTETPDIIKRISTLETYTGLEAVLEMAQNNGSVIEYGKYKSISDPDGCYLIMVNREKSIVGILSPKYNGIRLNLKDGSEINSESMKNFMNCVPICVRTK